MPSIPAAVAALSLLLTVSCSGSHPLVEPVPTPPSTHPPATAAGGTTATAPTATPARSLAWAHCEGVHAKTDTCALLAVPLDRAHPARTIDLHLIRRVASDRGRRVGALLLNPGGPGGSTVDEFDGLADGLSAVLRQRFDVVGWDPRGVGASSPVRCLDGKGLDRFTAASGDPTTPDGLATLTRTAQLEADACQAKSGDLLPFVGTVDVAKDVDDIRAALGEARLTYLGYSYGTLLGATYASLFPTRVRALVLDGAVDPGLGPIQGAEVQAVGFQSALETFLADCSRRGSSCAWHPGGDLRAHYRALLAHISAAPLPTGSDRPLTQALAITGVAAALYSRDSWTYLEQGLAAADGGDGHVLLALADFLDERDKNGNYSNLLDALNAVNCRDEQSPTGTAPYVASYRRLLATAPDFAAFGFGGYVCAIWPARPASPPVPVHADGIPPVLVVGSTGDPATPLSEAVGLTARLSGARLLTRRGEGHTGYDSSACVRGHVDAYLLDPVTLPAVGTTCPS